MESLTSTKSFSGYYAVVFFRILFCLVMAFLTGLHGEALSKGGEVVMILMSISLLVAAFYTLVVFYINSPDIKVDKTVINIGRKTYHWSALEDVAFTGKKQFKYVFFGSDRETLMLKFIGSEPVYLFDDVYANLSQIKAFIYSEVVGNPVQTIEDGSSCLTEITRINLRWHP